MAEMAIEDCVKCGGDASVIELNAEQWFVRVRCITKCKFYKHGGSASCQTQIRPTRNLAILAWNDTYGEQSKKREAEHQ